jgi:hypothetical protein
VLYLICEICGKRLIDSKIKLNRHHRFMVGFIESYILQVLHDRLLVGIAAVGRTFGYANKLAHALW